MRTHMHMHVCVHVYVLLLCRLGEDVAQNLEKGFHGNTHPRFVGTAKQSLQRLSLSSLLCSRVHPHCGLRPGMCGHELSQAIRAGAASHAHFCTIAEYLEGGHGGDGAMLRCLLVCVHVDLDEVHPRPLQSKLLKHRRNRLARPAPCGGKVDDDGSVHGGGGGEDVVEFGFGGWLAHRACLWLAGATGSPKNNACEFLL